MKFRDNQDDEFSNESEIKDFPALPQFSICMWINFHDVESQQQKEDPEAKKILSYVNSPKKEYFRSFLTVDSFVMENGETPEAHIRVFLK